jgi:hypothetical protein
MNKKIIIIFVGLLVSIGSITLAHMHFTKDSSPLNQSLFMRDISYAQLQDNIKSNINVRAYFMCEKNADCEYVIYSLIKPIMNKYHINILTEVTFVDMDDVSRQVSSTRLKELYQIQSIPAFVLINTSNLDIIATLEYTKSNPLTQDLIEEWLLTHRLLR